MFTDLLRNDISANIIWTFIWTFT